TYTTTEIHSVAENGSQRLEVKAKTDHAFEKMIKELEEKAQGDDDRAKNAKNDLKTINENIETLQHIIDRGDQVFSFERLEGIEENLKKYVADPAYAHAVQCRRSVSIQAELHHWTELFFLMFPDWIQDWANIWKILKKCCGTVMR
ncbi:MAG: hypothetical protein V2I97_20655, partial [Desulfococcaceae bacterium]|nr:hypothetical protein [Desulfococcaceae bacterium]